MKDLGITINRQCVKHIFTQKISIKKEKHRLLDRRDNGKSTAAKNRTIRISAHLHGRTISGFMQRSPDNT